MNRRRSLLLGLCAVAIGPAVGRAQTKTVRIGVLMPAPWPQYMDAMLGALRERGWVAGRNLEVLARYTQGDLQRTEVLARELAVEGVALICTSVTGTAIAAHRATQDVPIVLLTSGYPVEGGLAKSLARPGGRVTGITVYAGGGGLFGKYVELLRELVPSLRELGVLWGYAPPLYTEAQVAPATDELHRAAKLFGINVRSWQTGRGSDLDVALAAAARAPLDALFVTGGTIHGLKEFTPRIAELVLRRRLPALSDSSANTFTGACTLAYSAVWTELATRAAYFVDRILRGANPGDLPIEQPTKYELSVNLKIAKAIGITIPQSLQLRADRVIE